MLRDKPNQAEGKKKIEVTNTTMTIEVCVYCTAVWCSSYRVCVRGGVNKLVRCITTHYRTSQDHYTSSFITLHCLDTFHHQHYYHHHHDYYYHHHYYYYHHHHHYYHHHSAITEKSAAAGGTRNRVIEVTTPVH